LQKKAMEACCWPPAHNWFCSRILSLSPTGLVCYGAKNHLVVVEPAAADTEQLSTADNWRERGKRQQASPPKCTVIHEAFDDRTRVSVLLNK
jgi:hypothetical protein